MGFDVHVHVCIPADDNDGLAQAAIKHERTVSEIVDSNEAVWFLQDLAKRTGKLPGPKGGLSLWGVVGNYTRVQEFVDALKPFWLDILSNELGPCDFERILVFEEREQEGCAYAYEIFLSEDEASGKLLVPHTISVMKHKCPFSWRQF